MSKQANAAKRAEGLRACADGLNKNPDKEFALKCMRHAADRMEELETELAAVTEQLKAAREVHTLSSEVHTLSSEVHTLGEQRDEYRDIASELIAMIRINVMRDTFKTATIQQVDEHLKPWIARIAAVKGGSDES